VCGGRVCAGPCRRPSQRSSLATDRAHPPPRTRRAFVASRWNTYAARRRESPSRTALAPTSRPSTSAESECTHQSASSRDGASAGSPVNASDACACRHASTAWSNRTRGAWCRGQYRYICIAVSTAPVQVLQCARPAGPTLPYEPASPPLVRACTCHLDRAYQCDTRAAAPRRTANARRRMHRGLGVAKRACVFGAGAHVGQAVYKPPFFYFGRGGLYTARARAQPPPPPRLGRAPPRQGHGGVAVPLVSSPSSCWVPCCL
jgi:hypothetical protein